MKTTMDMPDAVMNELRRQAAREQVPMRDIVLEALRRELDRRSAAPARVDFAFPTVGGDGLQSGVEMHHLRDYSYSDQQ